jgi:hypothetical protein
MGLLIMLIMLIHIHLDKTMKQETPQPEQLSFSGSSGITVIKGTEKFLDYSEKISFMKDLEGYYHYRISQNRPTDNGRSENEIKSEIWLNVWDCWKMKNRLGYNVNVSITDLI